MKKPDCKNCTKRKFACHSTCPEYVISRVINMYKNDKRSAEFDAIYNSTLKGRSNQKLRDQLNGHARR